MGKIKLKIVKKSAHALVNRGIEFGRDFEKNKQMLRGINPSKKLRNQMAGFLSRIAKQKVNAN